MGFWTNTGASAAAAISVTANIVSGTNTPEQQVEQAGHYLAQQAEQRVEGIRISTEAKAWDANQSGVDRRK